MGPGKADLLEGIRDTGSIAQAASRMGMSYMRAWGLVRTMNGCFREPLVVAERGGNTRGGARLTQSGEQVLGLYREMERQALASTQPNWERLRRFLAAP